MVCGALAELLKNSLKTINTSWRRGDPVHGRADDASTAAFAMWLSRSDTPRRECPRLHGTGNSRHTHSTAAQHMKRTTFDDVAEVYRCT